MNFNFLTIALSILMTQGESALHAAFTPPQSVVKAITKKTGANYAQAIEERDEAATEWVRFIEQLVNFVPPQELTGQHDNDDLRASEVLNGPMDAVATQQLLGGSLIDLASLVYRIFGRAYLVRFLTPPQSFVATICAKSGADYGAAMEARNLAVTQLVEFVEALVDRHFVDPD